MKALEKDRSRRYETANGFARDIQRYLAGDPVEACPPSVRPIGSATSRQAPGRAHDGAAFAATLMVTSAVSTWQAVRATRAERLATGQALRRSRLKRDRGPSVTAR